jgi:hypothetical protein
MPEMPSAGTGRTQKDVNLINRSSSLVSSKAALPRRHSDDAAQWDRGERQHLDFAWGLFFHGLNFLALMAAGSMLASGLTDMEASGFTDFQAYVLLFFGAGLMVLCTLTMLLKAVELAHRPTLERLVPEGSGDSLVLWWLLIDAPFIDLVQGHSKHRYLQEGQPKVD